MKKFAYICVGALLLSACGGSPPRAVRVPESVVPPAVIPSTPPQPVATPGQAQGIYMGSYQFGMAFYSVILPNDSYYSVEGKIVDGVITEIYRLTAGSGASASGQYKGNLTLYLSDDFVAQPLSATYVSGSGYNAEVGSQSLSATVVPASMIDYNAASLLARITGVWSGVYMEDMLVGNYPGSLTVNADGSFSGSTHGCLFTGTLTPNEKNYYTATVTLGGSPCFAQNESGSGVAIEMTLASGKHQIVFVAATPKYGIGFAAVR